MAENGVLQQPWTACCPGSQDQPAPPERRKTSQTCEEKTPCFPPCRPLTTLFPVPNWVSCETRRSHPNWERASSLLEMPLWQMLRAAVPLLVFRLITFGWVVERVRVCTHTYKGAAERT